MTTILDPPGKNPPNPFSKHIETVVRNPKSAPETVPLITTDIAAASDPSNARWQFWDAFFTAIVSARAPIESELSTHSTGPDLVFKPNDDSSSHPHQSLLALFDELHETPVTDKFSAQWRDVHDILHAWRAWDGIRVTAQADDAQSGPPPSPDPVAPKFLRFCEFSAALVGTRGYAREYVHVINVFYACRDGLESKPPSNDEDKRGAGDPHQLLPEELWALDVRVAAVWVRSGGLALSKTSVDELRTHWSAALADKTHYYPQTDGLTLSRWMLWAERLDSFVGDARLDQETQVLVREAALALDRVLT